MNPLDQLKDIHLPAAVGFWPPALIWWVLLFALFVVIGLCIWFYKRQAWRRQAKQALAAIDWQQPQQAYRDANKLLKRICLQKISNQCTQLSGEDWLHYLDDQVKHPIFMPKLRPFAHILDEPNIHLDNDALKHAIDTWIRKVKC